MQLTEHYGLKKPLDNETAEIQDIRDNMDLIDAALFSMLTKALKGAAGGLAELGNDGKVPSAQLPSYVDDVLEYATLSSFPATGETGKIYVAQDSNKTYRWSGSGYVEISASLALGETSATAYPGDKGKAAYDHSQATGNPHGTTAAQVGAAVTTTLTATLTTTWTGSSAPYSQTISVPGILATDNPVIDVVLTADTAASKLILEAWANVSRIVTAANSITAYCYEDKPSVAIPLQLKVVR